jgi:hypothetical protein
MTGLVTPAVTPKPAMAIRIGDPVTLASRLFVFSPYSLEVRFHGSAESGYESDLQGGLKSVTTADD